jgi:hypothetical protein
VEQVAAAGGDIDDDDAIITGTGMVVSGSANTSGVLDHEEGQHTPEFKVWSSEGQDEESRASAASGQPQHHVETAADLLSNIQNPSTTSMESSGSTSQVVYSSTIDMKDLGGASSGPVAVVVSTTAGGSVSWTTPVQINSSSLRKDPLSNVITTTGSGGTATVDMNLLNQPQFRTEAGGPGVTKRSSSVDSPGHDEERLTVVEGDDSSQDSANAAGSAGQPASASAASANS